MNRRNLLQRSIVMGLLGIADIATVLAMSRVPYAEGINKVQGEVRINDQTAKKDDLVKLGDTVATGSNSSVIFVFKRDAFLLRENSQVKVSGDGAAIQELRVLTGKLLSVFAPGEKRIRTASATIGIRGTGAYVDAGEDRTYICVCYGGADLYSATTGGLLERVKTHHHDSPRYIYPGDSSRQLIEPAPVVDHTDEELTLLESLVGRNPPFAAWASDY
ncbi:MAG: FecR domain-containing protein [Gammaproteobacteria bacterium]|nr:FecR domain-containing protein [Gammaproteobacteria bacterium]